MELKIIRLQYEPRIGVSYGHTSVESFKHVDLKNPNNYVQTMIGVGEHLTLNTDKRKSSTFASRLKWEFPSEMSDFLDGHSILRGSDYSDCEIIKYEVGDFFTCHRDTIVSDCMGRGEHKYTCLVYGTFEQEDGYFEGGELIFRHPEKLYDICIDLSNEIKNNKYVVVVFSVDMWHEVLPIKNGTRYVLKKPLFVKTPTPAVPINVDKFEGDGGFQSMLDVYAADY